MKTKHFLITTEDGSAVAVISSHSEIEFLDKLEKCLREQLDSPNLIIFDVERNVPFIKYIKREKFREKILRIKYERIEIY